MMTVTETSTTANRGGGLRSRRRAASFATTTILAAAAVLLPSPADAFQSPSTAGFVGGRNADRRRRRTVSIRTPGLASRGPSPPFLRATAGSSDDGGGYEPTVEELATQKAEAYSAVANFHETTMASAASGLASSLLGGVEAEEFGESYWECLPGGAASYAVPADPAAGLRRSLRRSNFRGHRCGVSVEMNLSELRGGTGSARGLRLAETYRFNDGDDSWASVFARSSPLGNRADVDVADGSYSLDAASDPPDVRVGPSDDGEDDDGATPPRLPLLPSELLGPAVDPASVTFVVEHALVMSETERRRCFLAYAAEEGGKADEDGSGGSRRLVGVVVLDETKVTEEAPSASVPSASSANNPLDLIEIKGGGGNDMDRLFEALEKNEERAAADDDEAASTLEENPAYERHSPGIFGLTSAVWLGDSIVRERLVDAVDVDPNEGGRGGTGGKGFGSSGGNAKSGANKKKGAGDREASSDTFANWSMGMQKVSLRYEWDYGDRIAQSLSHGRSMGGRVRTENCPANVRSDGTVTLNESRRGPPGEEKMVVMDLDGGAYVAGLIGSIYFRAPRYMSFSKSRNYDAEPLLTEFTVFQRPGNGAAAPPPSVANPADRLPVSEVDGGDADSEGGMEPPPEPEERLASRITRLYDGNDGRFVQGCSSFFSTRIPDWMDGSADDLAAP